jgi:hypothetical protein
MQTARVSGTLHNKYRGKHALTMVAARAVRRTCSNREASEYQLLLSAPGLLSNCGLFCTVGTARQVGAPFYYKNGAALVRTPHCFVYLHLCRVRPSNGSTVPVTAIRVFQWPNPRNSPPRWPYPEEGRSYRANGAPIGVDGLPPLSLATGLPCLYV